MDMLKALKPIEELEAGLAGLYDRYSGLLTGDPEASAFFAKLSQDEKAHQQVVQYQRRLIARNPRMFESTAIDADLLEKTLKDIAYLVQSQGEITLDEMVRIALEFESGTAEHYYRTAMAQANADVGQFLKTMGLSSSRHLKMVQEFAEKRGFIAPTPPKRTL